MRRGEKEIKHRAEIDSIIRDAHVCRLGMSDGSQPYVVPLNFGYDGTALYFHCAHEGRKIDILRRNNRVCVEFDQPEGLIRGAEACDWGMRYRSVIVTGTARLLDDIQERREALQVLMAQYSDRRFSFSDDMLKRTAVIKVVIESVSGKQSPRD